MTREPYTSTTIEAYLEFLASAEPEPGGGSAAALVGALAAALVTMVTNLTLGKEKYAGAQDQMADLKVNAEFARSRLSELITLDAEAYSAVAEAMRLPKDSDEEKGARSVALQKALRGAAEVPLTVAEAAAEVARLSLPAAELGNVNAISDAAVAAVLADAAAHSAALNVKINLAWLDDKDYARDAWTRVEAVLSETAHLRDVVLAMTYAKL